MTNQLQRLEERVAAAAALIAHLRSEVARLEARTTEAPSPPHPSSETEPAADALRPLREELSRLHAERIVVRDRVRALIREIDAVTW